MKEANKLGFPFHSQGSEGMDDWPRGDLQGTHLIDCWHLRQLLMVEGGVDKRRGRYHLRTCTCIIIYTCTGQVFLNCPVGLWQRMMRNLPLCCRTTLLGHGIRHRGGPLRLPACNSNNYVHVQGGRKSGPAPLFLCTWHAKLVPSTSSYCRVVSGRAVQHTSHILPWPPLP